MQNAQNIIIKLCHYVEAVYYNFSLETKTHYILHMLHTTTYTTATYNTTYTTYLHTATYTTYLVLVDIIQR